MNVAADIAGSRGVFTDKTYIMMSVNMASMIYAMPAAWTEDKGSKPGNIPEDFTMGNQTQVCEGSFRL